MANGELYFDGLLISELKSSLSIIFPQRESNIYFKFISGKESDALFINANKAEIIVELEYAGMGDEKHHTKENLDFSKPDNVSGDKYQFHISATTIESD